MTAPLRLIVVLATVSALPGCAAVHSLDRLAEQADVRSNCHTSTGEWVGGPCSIEWSATKTVSTTTTVVTTTTTSPAAAPAPADD